jgi:phytol kinase
MRDVLLILTLLLASRLSLSLVDLARRRCALSPESTRKLLHVAIGLLLCPLPWLFTHIWPVAVLCALYAALLLARHLSPGLDRNIAPVIFGVGRRSIGDLLFPVAVLLLFTFSRHDPPAYLAAMLTLTLADTAAAVVGARYAQFPYTTPAGATKSLEGSTAFAAVTFAATHLSLLLCTDIGRLESVLIALTLAAVLTVIEALSSAGLDNLLVPLGTLLLLRRLRPMPPDALAVVAALAFLTTILLATSFRTNSEISSNHTPASSV